MAQGYGRGDPDRSVGEKFARYQRGCPTEKREPLLSDADKHAEDLCSKTDVPGGGGENWLGVEMPSREASEFSRWGRRCWASEDDQLSSDVVGVESRLGCPAKSPAPLHLPYTLHPLNRPFRTASSLRLLIEPTRVHLGSTGVRQTCRTVPFQPISSMMMSWSSSPI